MKSRRLLTLVSLETNVVLSIVYNGKVIPLHKMSGLNHLNLKVQEAVDEFHIDHPNVPTCPTRQTAHSCRLFIPGKDEPKEGVLSWDGHCDCNGCNEEKDESLFDGIRAWANGVSINESTGDKPCDEAVRERLSLKVPTSI